MGYKVDYILKKSKMVFIIAGILWIALAILFVAPVSVSIVETAANGQVNSNEFIDILLKSFGNIGSNLSKIFLPAYIGSYGKCLGYCTIAVFLITLVGFVKSAPKNEYTDIEHGSSDWAEGGEQYKVLSKNNGILLAEKHYLPVDKRGNVNVLVVGRFRFSENLHLMLYQMHTNY